MTSRCITWHDHHITWHDTLPLTTLTHLTSPHKQPHCFISPRNQPRDIKTGHITTKAYHHHGTAEGSFTAKKWFGHRAGRSPCAHSRGKFFFCYIVLFPFETSAPGSPGNYLYVYRFSSRSWEPCSGLSRFGLTGPCEARHFLRSVSAVRAPSVPLSILCCL